MFKEVGNTMQKIIAKKEWFLISLSFLAFFLPINQRLAALGVGFVVLATLLDNAKRVYRLPYLLILMLLLFLYHPIWLMSVVDKSTGLREIETKLSLLIFPVLAIFSHRISRKDLYWLFSLFTLGIIVFACVTMLIGAYQWVATGKSHHIVYWRLAQYFHPTYLGFYANIGIGFMGLLVFQKKRLFGSKLLHVVGMSILAIYVVLLTSKAAIITLLIVLGIALFWAIKRQVNLQLFIAMFVLMGIIGLANPEVNSRLGEFFSVTTTKINKAGPNKNSEVVDQKPTEKSIAKSSTSIRLLTWRASLEVMTDHPLGVGTGMVTPSLMEIYKKEGETFVAEKQYNSHNQYLQFGVAFGYMGFITLALLIALGILQGIRTGNRLLVLFVSLLGVNMLFESFLELQAGVVVVGYFFFVLLITDLQKD